MEHEKYELKFLRQVLEHYVSIGSNFTLLKGTYSAKIIFTDGSKITFADSFHSKEAFTAARRIKESVRSNGEVLKYILHNFKNDVDYYKIGDRREYYGNAVNIDLNNAYAQTLFNLKLIDSELLSYLLKLEKKDRLVSVGMLASSKAVFEYSGGKIVHRRFDVNEPDLRNLFFKISKEVDLRLQLLSRYFGERYLFFWVDGIYLTNLAEGDIEEINNIIPDYDYKIEHLKNFKMNRDRHIVNIEFQKMGSKGKDKLKTFSISDKDLVLINSYMDTSFLSTLTDNDIKKLHAKKKK
jgi:hypothetical protein